MAKKLKAKIKTKVETFRNKYKKKAIAPQGGDGGVLSERIIMEVKKRKSTQNKKA